MHATATIKSAATIKPVTGPPQACEHCGRPLPPKLRRFCSMGCRRLEDGKSELQSDPTPEEIAERTAAIRSTWDEATKARRRVRPSEPGQQRWALPVVSTRNLFGEGRLNPGNLGEPTHLADGDF